MKENKNWQTIIMGAKKIYEYKRHQSIQESKEQSKLVREVRESLRPKQNDK